MRGSAFLLFLAWLGGPCAAAGDGSNDTMTLVNAYIHRKHMDAADGIAIADMSQKQCPRQHIRCPTPKLGLASEVEVRNGFKCIGVWRICDGTFDCPNAEDELPDNCFLYAAIKIARQETLRGLPKAVRQLVNQAMEERAAGYE